MYSLVLMTAMATSPSTPDFHGYFRERLLGNGCAGQSAGCFGMSAAASCQGCSCHGGLFSGDRLRSFFSFGGNSCTGCSGCYGCGGAALSCQGYAISYGCNGTAYSCQGFAISYGCGSVAFSCGGGFIDMGTPFSQPVPTALPGSYPTIPPTSLPMDGSTPYAQPVPAESREYTPNNQLPPPGSLAASPNRATVVVRLPADAKLLAEGRELKLTGSERTFVSPELPAGRDYTYTFRMELTRDGRIEVEQKTITVRAGQLSTLEFATPGRPAESIPAQMPPAKPASTTSLLRPDLVRPEPPSQPSTPQPSAPQPSANQPIVAQPIAAQPIAAQPSDTQPSSQRARILVQVPPGATLYVNDVKQSGHDFQTPPLPPGKTFQYQMKIETTVQGYPETATQIITIRAGDSLTVDFTQASARR